VAWRGFNPFQPINPVIPTEITWQDWISSRGVYDDELGFKRDFKHDDD